MFNKAALFSLFVVASKVTAAPTPSDSQVLQFALTLEHLENAFYTGGLDKFSAQDFQEAGLPAWARGRFEQISQHERLHVELLTAALGPEQAVKPCEYDFGSAYKDARAFAAMSMVFETVGASAYLGGSKFLTNKDFLTTAASILAVESRQASWVSSSVMQLQPWNGPYDVPLTLSGAYSLAEPFIKRCPSSNQLLPVRTFPKLTLSKEYPSQGERITVEYSGRGTGEKYVAWLVGLGAIYTPVSASGQTSVPESLRGTVYAVVVSRPALPIDENMLSGFAIAQFPFASDAGDA